MRKNLGVMASKYKVSLGDDDDSNPEFDSGNVNILCELCEYTYTP